MADQQVKQRPIDVHRWRRHAFAGRVGEGCWEHLAGNTVDEMRNEVRKEHSREEACNVMIPLHRILDMLNREKILN